MNTMCLYSFVVALVVLFSSGCNSQGIISKSQALNAVRQFEDNPYLQMEAEYDEYEDDQSATGQTRIYHVSDSEFDYEYEVNAVTGEVLCAYYYLRMPENESDTPYGAYTQTQCSQIALDFAQAHYASFANNFRFDYGKWDGKGWSFRWVQDLPYGLFGPNIVCVDVNGETGLVQSYVSQRDPVFIPQQPPSITPQQAVQFANQAVGITTPISNDTPKLSVNKSNMYWSVFVTGRDSNEVVGDYWVYIDAYSGSALKVQSPMAPGMAPLPDDIKAKQLKNRKSSTETAKPAAKPTKKVIKPARKQTKNAVTAVTKQTKTPAKPAAKAVKK